MLLLASVQPRHSSGQRVHISAGVKGGKTDPYGPDIQRPCGAVRQRRAVEPGTDGNPLFSQCLPHVFTVHAVHLKGEHPRLAEEAGRRKDAYARQS